MDIINHQKQSYNDVNFAFQVGYRDSFEKKNFLESHLKKGSINLLLFKDLFKNNYKKLLKKDVVVNLNENSDEINNTLSNYISSLKRTILKTGSTKFCLYPNFEISWLNGPSGFVCEIPKKTPFSNYLFQYPQFRIITFTEIDMDLNMLSPYSSSSSSSSLNRDDIISQMRLSIPLKSLCPPLLSDDENSGWGFELGENGNMIGLFTVDEQNTKNETIKKRIFIGAETGLNSSLMLDIYKRDLNIQICNQNIKRNILSSFINENNNNIKNNPIFNIGNWELSLDSNLDYLKNNINNDKENKNKYIGFICEEKLNEKFILSLNIHKKNLDPRDIIYSKFENNNYYNQQQQQYQQQQQQQQYNNKNYDDNTNIPYITYEDEFLKNDSIKKKLLNISIENNKRLVLHFCRILNAKPIRCSIDNNTNDIFYGVSPIINNLNNTYKSPLTSITLNNKNNLYDNNNDILGAYDSSSSSSSLDDNNNNNDDNIEEQPIFPSYIFNIIEKCINWWPINIPIYPFSIIPNKDDLLNNDIKIDDLLYGFPIGKALYLLDIIFENSKSSSNINDFLEKIKKGIIFEKYPKTIIPTVQSEYNTFRKKSDSIIIYSSTISTKRFIDYNEEILFQDSYYNDFKKNEINNNNNLLSSSSLLYQNNDFFLKQQEKQQQQQQNNFQLNNKISIYDYNKSNLDYYSNINDNNKYVSSFNDVNIDSKIIFESINKGFDYLKIINNINEQDNNNIDNDINNNINNNANNIDIERFVFNEDYKMIDYDNYAIINKLPISHGYYCLNSLLNYELSSKSLISSSSSSQLLTSLKPKIWENDYLNGYHFNLPIEPIIDKETELSARYSYNDDKINNDEKNIKNNNKNFNDYKYENKPFFFSHKRNDIPNISNLINLKVDSSKNNEIIEFLDFIPKQLQYKFIDNRKTISNSSEVQSDLFCKNTSKGVNNYSFIKDYGIRFEPYFVFLSEEPSFISKKNL